MEIMEAFMWCNRADSEIDLRPSVDFEIMIYHYTSPEGLLGIVADNISLRFTRNDCMNDYSEGKEIDDIYRSVCIELFAEKKIDEVFYKRIIDIKPENREVFYYKIEGGCRGGRLAYESYICCFSQKKDALPMWNYYVKNSRYQGYNLGLNVKEIQEQLSFDEEYIMSYHIGPVVYNNDEKKEIIKKIINEAYLAKDSGLQCIENGIADRLMDLRMIFKNAAFEHEEEVRIIINIPKERREDCLSKEVKIYYRNVQGLIAPYIEIKFPKGTLKEVRIGPLMEDDKAKELLEEWLCGMKYRDVDVVNSKVPIRF